MKKAIKSVFTALIAVVAVWAIGASNAYAENYYGYSDQQCQRIVQDASGDNINAICKIPAVVAYKTYNGNCTPCPNPNYNNRQAEGRITGKQREENKASKLG